MSHPMSEPVQEACVNGASTSRDGLFSHLQEDEALDQRPVAGDGGDWRATAFSAGHGNAPDRPGMAGA